MLRVVNQTSASEFVANTIPFSHLKIEIKQTISVKAKALEDRPVQITGLTFAPLEQRLVPFSPE